MEKKLLGDGGSNLTTVYHAEGCKECNSTGYKGRIALLEILRMDADLDELVAKKVSQRELLEAAKQKGFSTLADDGIAQVIKGSTTLDELSRVVDFTARLAD